MTEGYFWPSAQAVDHLNALLDLPATGREQDWEVELADAARLDEWVELLDGGSLEQSDRSALALLMTCSILYADGVVVRQSTLDRVRSTLHRDPAVLADMKSYWARFLQPTGDTKLDAENAEFCRNVTHMLA
ncbi:MAG: hypothetical protein ACTHJR_11710 [Sphingomonas sp.]|uniref:hypothetical protein n=1 Tax=Sphingomonas sp. TaxID=28214 RepID=UPI003F81A70C